MKKESGKPNGRALQRLCDLLDLARAVAREVPASTHASYTELVESLATTQLCARRLNAERTETKRKAPARV